MFLVLYGIAILLACLIQTSPLFFAVDAGLHVDLTLLVVVYFSLFWGGHRVLYLGFVTGILQDALSSELLGLNALSKSLTAFVIYTLCHNMQTGSLMAQGLFTSIAILIDTLTRLTLMGVLQSHTFTLPTVLSTLVQQTLVGVPLLPCVCYGLETLAQGLRLRPEKEQGNAAV
jgi:rod shape-determining protein MreD